MLRKLREIVGQYWGQVRFPGINDMGKKEAFPPKGEERLWNSMIRAGGCVDCATQPKRLVEGPSGGVNTNVFCPHCGQGYNLTPIAQWAERIHKDERYITKELR